MSKAQRIEIPLIVKDDGSVVLGKIGDKLDDVGKKAKQTQSAFDDFGKSLLSGFGVGAGFKATEMAADALVSVVKGIPATFAAWTSEALKTADTLSNLSATTLISVEGLQKLGRLGAPAGVSLETMARAALNVQRRMELVPKAFDQYGLSVAKLKGMAPEEAFREVAQAIKDIKDPAEQAAATMKLMGDRSGEMVRVIREGLGPVEDLGELTKKQVDDLDALGDATGEAGTAWKNLTMQFAAAIAQSPEVLGFIKDLAAGLGGMAAWVRDNGPTVTKWFDRLVYFTPGLKGLRDVLQDMAALPEIKTYGESKDRMAFFDPNKIVPPSLDGMFKYLKDSALDFAREAEAAQAKAEAAARKHIKALEDLDRAVLGATKSAMDAAAKEIEAWGKADASLGANEAAMLAASEAGEVAAMRQAYGLEELYKVVDQGSGLWTRYGDVVEQEMENATAGVRRCKEETESWGEQFRNNIGPLIEGMGGLFLDMADDADSAFGRIGRGLAGVGSSLSKLKSMGSDGNGAGGIKGALGTTDGKIQAGAAVAGAVGSMFGEYSATGGALKGAAKGAQIGMIAGPYGAAVGAVVGAVAGWIGAKKKAAKAMTEMKGKIIEQYGSLGAAEKEAEKYGINLKKAMDSKDPKKLADAMNDLAKKTAAAAQKAEILEAGMQRMVAGVAQWAGKLTGAAEAQARIFTAAFWGTVKEKGLTAAIDAFAEPFARMREQFPELMAPLGELFDKLGAGGAFREAADAAQGLNDTMMGMAAAGYLNVSMFNDFQAAGKAAYDQAIAGGATSAEALQSMLPLLGNAKALSEKYGYALDATTQSMIDQAEAAGYSFPTDPMLAMLDVLKEIAKVLGADIPASARAAGDAVKGIPRPPKPSDYAGGDYGYPDTGPPPGSGGMPAYALGTPFVPFTGTAQLHRGEAVIPNSGSALDKMAAKVAAAVAGGGSGDLNLTVDLVMDGQNFGKKVISISKNALNENIGGLRLAAKNAVGGRHN